MFIVHERLFRMTNKSWTRVPSILSTATATFSDNALRQEVIDFKMKIDNDGQLGSLSGTFDSILGNEFLHTPELFFCNKVLFN